MDQEELEQDRRIDPNELDMAVSLQPELFCKWSERAVKAKWEAERESFKLDQMKARLQIDCRKNPEKYDVLKITESVVESAVLIDPDFTAAQNNLFALQAEADILFKAAATMDQKKKMLELLVTLHGQQYFAGPSIPQDLITRWNDYMAKRPSAGLQKQGQMARKRVSIKA
jgi:hypothetical protein